MSGIVFFNSRILSDLMEFYTEKIGMEVWLQQEDCTVLKHGNMLLGFCTRQETGSAGMITFVYRTQREVDEMYHRIMDIATTSPRKNEKYDIYQFFAQDPEGRVLEFQCFFHPVIL